VRSYVKSNKFDNRFNKMQLGNVRVVNCAGFSFCIDQNLCQTDLFFGKTESFSTENGVFLTENDAFLTRNDVIYQWNFNFRRLFM
jgi:hypothetical protein